ncbi:MAG: glycerol-3-phosphate 1-O-acyltransferase PlsY [Gemmatimonadales bacterium]
MTPPTVAVVLWLLAAYLFGSIPTSLLAARWAGGIDLREFGSKNLGATNLYRALGLKVAIPVGVFDVLKGTIPVVLARVFHHGRLGGSPSEYWPMVVGLAAVLGHVFSPFVRFRGGKGVATAAGVFTGLVPGAVAVGIVVWVIVVRLSGYVSLGSMLAVAAFVAAVPPLYPHWGIVTTAGLIILVFVVFTHRANIQRLMNGTENRFGRGKKAGPPAGAT